MPPRIDPSLIPPSPTLDFEAALWAAGVEAVAGIDEAGRGALAGPVYAGAVMLPDAPDVLHELHGVRDSKEMTPEERDLWAEAIKSRARAWAVGAADAAEIDALGIVPATRLAAVRALKQLLPAPGHLLIDYLVLHEEPTPQTWLYKGDARSLSIAAASVLAKTARDAQLLALHDDFPDYGFAAHKGYGTARHRQALADLGPCAQHRHSFTLTGQP
jgi:ribonuclease HII